MAALTESSALGYARGLLRDLGASDAPEPEPPVGSAAAAWARSGGLALTGHAEGPPVLPTAPLAACADGALAALRALAAPGALAGVDGAALLGERAASAGLGRRGRLSVGGGARLLRASDGWLVVGLGRGEEDLALLPAWLEAPLEGEVWGWLERELARRSAAELVARARLLGLAAAPAGRPEPGREPWLRATPGREAPLPPRPAPCFVDLSSLWAGPLCASLLAALGARVVKLESTRRPDGLRGGPPAFFALLNAGKQSVALDLGSAEGCKALRRLVDAADGVVEASRPRALRQLGLDAEEWIAARPGRVWISITGYGRREPEAGWVAFGDDAAAAAGACFCLPEREAPLFVGDAIADPLTGIHAALAAWAYWRAGRGALLDVALRDVVAHAIASGATGEAVVVRQGDGFAVRDADGVHAVEPPRARRAPGPARALGADTRHVLAQLV